jgi:hypothetical protein
MGIGSASSNHSKSGHPIDGSHPGDYTGFVGGRVLVYADLVHPDVSHVELVNKMCAVPNRSRSSL